MLLSIASLRGSPGVTTTALVAARVAAGKGFDVTLVEADSDGGYLSKLLYGLKPDVGLATLSAEASQNPDASVADHTQPLEKGSSVEVLIAPNSQKTTVRMIDVSLSSIMHYAASHPQRLTIVDCGRLAGAASYLFDEADTRWLLTPGDHASILSLRDLMQGRGEDFARIQVFVRGGPYEASDLPEVGVTNAEDLPDAPKVAEAARGTRQVSPRKFRKSSLAKAVLQALPELTATQKLEGKGASRSKEGSSTVALDAG